MYFGGTLENSGECTANSGQGYARKAIAVNTCKWGGGGLDRFISHWVSRTAHRFWRICLGKIIKWINNCRTFFLCVFMKYFAFSLLLLIFHSTKRRLAFGRIGLSAVEGIHNLRSNLCVGHSCMRPALFVSETLSHYNYSATDMLCFPTRFVHWNVPVPYQGSCEAKIKLRGNAFILHIKLTSVL